MVTPRAETLDALAFTPVQHAFILRVREGQRVIDGERAGAGGTVPSQKDCSRAAPIADRHCAIDDAYAFKCALVDLHRAAARSGAGFILNQERAFANSSAAGVGIRVAESELAVPNLFQ